MKILTALCIFVVSITSCTHTYYVVRHADKQTGPGVDPNDPPLTPAGEQRALALRDSLLPKSIKRIYSTQRIRTESTARPLSQAINIPITPYRNDTMQAFISRLRRSHSNTLIVGHSNTIDDITNGLTGRQSVPGDVSEAVYDNMFIIKYSTFLSRRITFRAIKYGAPTP